MQSRNNRRRKNQKGTSVLEFSLIIRPTVPMLMGVVVVGNELGRAVEAAQVCRDADSMYVRGVDFAQSGNQAELARIGQALNLQSSNSGNGIVILSKITFIPDPSSSCGLPADVGYSTGTTGQYRLAQRTIIGNTSLPGTHFPTTGTPTYDSENNVTNYSDYTNGTAATISNFQNTLALYPGQFSYVAETSVNQELLRRMANDPLSAVYQSSYAAGAFYYVPSAEAVEPSVRPGRVRYPPDREIAADRNPNSSFWAAESLLSRIIERDDRAQWPTRPDFSR